MKLNYRERLYLGLGCLYFWILSNALKWNRAVTQSYVSNRIIHQPLQDPKVVVSPHDDDEEVDLKHQKYRSLGVMEFQDDKHEGEGEQQTEGSERAGISSSNTMNNNDDDDLASVVDPVDENEDDDMYFLPPAGKEKPLVSPTANELSNTNNNNEYLDTEDDDEEETDEEMYDVSLLSDKITPESPLFIMNLPNSENLVVDRYLKCAGLQPNEDYARFWAKQPQDELVQPNRRRPTIGSCMSMNMGSGSGRGILEGCGEGVRVWSEIDSFRMSQGNRTCSFPNLRLDVVEAMVDEYPTATFLNMRKDPSEWYKSLDFITKKRWSTWCNGEDIHPELQFPDAYAPAEDWIKFYEDYQDFLRHTITLEQQEHPSLTYIEVDLSDTPTDTTASMLQDKLGVPETCWNEASSKPSKHIALPIFVASLPKSATMTTHDYLNCGFGVYEGAHHWTKYEESLQSVKVGQCMEENMRNGRLLLDNCGDYKHWSDIGEHGDYGERKCFYPSLDVKALQAIYESYPYGTIMNVIRDAQAWVNSVHKWDNLDTRWSQHCSALFPPKDSTFQDWVNFYHKHNQQLRDFAQNHPTMTYVEVHLDDANQTSSVLEENFGFPDQCWGHTNKREEAVARREADRKKKRQALGQAAAARKHKKKRKHHK